MKQKFFFVLAALMMLTGTSAMAQSETLKGDVNGDGVVDVADIAAVIKIMTDNGDIETKYYWYVGQNNPASIDTKNLKEASNEAGWHLIGTSTDDFTLTFNNDNCIDFNGDAVQYYVVIPNSLTVYAADGTTNVESIYFDKVTSNIDGYKTLHNKTADYEVVGLVIK